HLMDNSRVVLVTGGAYGIGRGIVKEFACHGESVVIADINEERGTALQSAILSQGGRALFLPSDVRDNLAVRALMERTVAEFGRLDVLCNNAGIERYRRADEYTDEDWDAIVETN